MKLIWRWSLTKPINGVEIIEPRKGKPVATKTIIPSMKARMLNVSSYVAINLAQESYENRIQRTADLIDSGVMLEMKTAKPQRGTKRVVKMQGYKT
jgi:hypothetical protein